ncbi:unnamed protein product [Ectocarpus sp. 6 AP-2014]
MRLVRAKFLKDFAPLHRLGLVWCERAAPPLLLADDSGEGGSLWRDCLAIVRNLTLLNNARASGGGGGAGPDGSAEEAIAKESAALCDNTVVLDGEGMRSALRLAAHPVNAPAKELLALLESLVLRAARSRVMHKVSGGAAAAAAAAGAGGGAPLGVGAASTPSSSSSGGGGGGATATPAKKPRLAAISPSSASPAGRSGGGGGGGGRSTTTAIGSHGAAGASGAARQAGGGGASMLIVKKADVEDGILLEAKALPSSTGLASLEL